MDIYRSRSRPGTTDRRIRRRTAMRTRLQRANAPSLADWSRHSKSRRPFHTCVRVSRERACECACECAGMYVPPLAHPVACRWLVGPLCIGGQIFCLAIVRTQDACRAEIALEASERAVAIVVESGVLGLLNRRTIPRRDHRFGSVLLGNILGRGPAWRASSEPQGSGRNARATHGLSADLAAGA